MKTFLFVCVHNAGRSQMAEAFVNHLARERGLPVRGISAGTVAGERINPVAEQVMAEIGIPMTGQQPKQLTQTMADGADRVITMGCGVDAEACPARIHLSEDWELDDPKGQPVEIVRRIRDQIRARVEALLADVAPSPVVACNRNAFTPEQAARHRTLVDTLRVRVRAVRDVADGWEYELPSDADTCLAAMEFATLERLCCPFLTFGLGLEPQGGPFTLTLTGPGGTKEILEDFLRLTPAADASIV
jgi:arsenate reductase